MLTVDIKKGQLIYRSRSRGEQYMVSAEMFVRYLRMDGLDANVAQEFAIAVYLMIGQINKIHYHMQGMTDQECLKRLVEMQKSCAGTVESGLAEDLRLLFKTEETIQAMRQRRMLRL